MEAFLHKNSEGPQGPESPSKDQAENPEDAKTPPTLPGGLHAVHQDLLGLRWLHCGTLHLIPLLPVSQAVSAKAFFSASCFLCLHFTGRLISSLFLSSVGRSPCLMAALLETRHPF